MIFISVIALTRLAIANWMSKIAVTDAIVNTTTKLMEAGFDFPIRHNG